MMFKFKFNYVLISSFALFSLNANAENFVTAPRYKRVCQQFGPFPFADSTTLTAKPERILGGTLLFKTGASNNGRVEVRELNGDKTLWIPEKDSESQEPFLCAPKVTKAEVCKVDDKSNQSADIVFFEKDQQKIVGMLQRGQKIDLLESYLEKGKWAFVQSGNVSGFLETSNLCLDKNSSIPNNEATQAFKMLDFPAHKNCYQSLRQRGENEIRRIVIHNSEGTMDSMISTFQLCESVASAHVGIDRDGTIVRFVEDSYAAFHSGYQGVANNPDSLGIEMVAYRPDNGGMTEAQKVSLKALVDFWMTKYKIKPPAPMLNPKEKFDNMFEFFYSPISIHRLVIPERGTECPSLLWADSPEGDAEFKVWRNEEFYKIGTSR